MIPRIIHYCWFGKGEKPDYILKCMDSWQQFFEGWEFIEWNEDNFDVDICAYSREAYLTRNFAHVSDVCRVWALHKFGGLYLDTDVNVIKKFDIFMTLPSFVSFEHNLIGTAVIGSLPNQRWLEKFFEYYQNHHFINIFGHQVRTPNTKILTRNILPELSYDFYPTIFPMSFFLGIEENGQLTAGKNTYSVHHYAASWRRNKTFRTKIINFIKGLKIRYWT